MMEVCTPFQKARAAIGNATLHTHRLINYVIKNSIQLKPLENSKERQQRNARSYINMQKIGSTHLYLFNCQDIYIHIKL